MSELHFPHLIETQRQRRGHDFYPAEEAAIPGLYETEPTSLGEKVLHVHYFAGACDWWIAEYDPRTGEAFGYACLGHTVGAEWGYVSLPELERVSVHAGLVIVERDLHWRPCSADLADLPR